jgi:hypothetical protein
VLGLATMAKAPQHVAVLPESVPKDPKLSISVVVLTLVLLLSALLAPTLKSTLIAKLTVTTSVVLLAPLLSGTIFLQEDSSVALLFLLEEAIPAAEISPLPHLMEATALLASRTLELALKLLLGPELT